MLATPRRALQHRTSCWWPHASAATGCRPRRIRKSSCVASINRGTHIDASKQWLAVCCMLQGTPHGNMDACYHMRLQWQDTHDAIKVSSMQINFDTINNLFAVVIHGNQLCYESVKVPLSVSGRMIHGACACGPPAAPPGAPCARGIRVPPPRSGKQMTTC
jgi:hypothetical protein